MMNDLITSARGHAERILLANGGELGLLGARQAYQQVWARDSMICGLGLLLCGDAGRAIHRRSLETLLVSSRRWARFHTTSAASAWPIPRSWRTGASY